MLIADSRKISRSLELSGSFDYLLVMPRMAIASTSGTVSLSKVAESVECLEARAVSMMRNDLGNEVPLYAAGRRSFFVAC